MKTKTLLTLAALVGGLSLTAFAQDAGGPPGQDDPGPGGPGGQDGPRHGMGGGPRMQPALIKALDANNDGVIDADEIANASAALKSLDKNGDGKLTRDEYLGKPPMGNRPPMEGSGGREGQGGQRGQRPQGPPPGDN